MLRDARLGGARYRDRRHQAATGAGRCAGEIPLIDSGSNPLQGGQKALALGAADDGVEVALMAARATRQLDQRLLAGGGQVETVGAAVAALALALEQAAPHQV